jgi:methyl-accepting chemotaxis protein
MSLRGKLFGMTVATIAALVFLIAVVLINGRSQMMEDRQDKVRNLVEVAVATVAHFEQQERAGTLPREQAQKAAKDALRAMRYQGNEYFWINDLSDVMVMHPIKPEMEGTKLDQIRDKNGKLLFVEFNRVVKAQGAGFVDYLWPKPGAADNVPKISYVAGFQPWGWVIGSGIYIDDVDASSAATPASCCCGAWGSAASSRSRCCCCRATSSARWAATPPSPPRSPATSPPATWRRRSSARRATSPA